MVASEHRTTAFDMVKLTVSAINVKCNHSYQVNSLEFPAANFT